MTRTPEAFANESVTFLRDVYLPRLRRALSALPDAELWWQPHSECISFGTILLHLRGNVTQWILSGLGKAPDARDRAREFSATSGPSGSELMSDLEETVHAACDLIASFGNDALQATYRIQDTDTTGLAAIYHVVEHFSWHTGQAVWIAKARAGAGHDVRFYDDQDLNAAKNP